MSSLESNRVCARPTRDRFIEANKQQDACNERTKTTTTSWTKEKQTISRNAAAGRALASAIGLWDVSRAQIYVPPDHPNANGICALEESTTNKPIDNNVIYDMHSTWWFGQHVRHFQAQLRNGLNKKWVLMLTVFAVKCDNFNCNHHFAEIVHTQRDEKRDTRAHVSHKIELSLCASSSSSCVHIVARPKSYTQAHRNFFKLRFSFLISCFFLNFLSP